MSSISRIVTIILALLSVSALGYYAYSLSSQTLTFPFRGTETQQGYAMQVLVAPPRLHFAPASDVLLDTGAVMSSLTRDGIPLTTEAISGEYRIQSTSAYISIEDTTPNPKDPPLILSSALYNEKKTTPYTLPRDITLTPTDVPYDLSISLDGDPRDQKYNISLYGLGDYSPDEIRYYAHYAKSSDCSISSWGAPKPYTPYIYTPKGMEALSGESISQTGASTPWIFEEVSPRIITPTSKDGQRWISQVEIGYDKNASRLCLIAGVAGQYRVIEDRYLDDFTLTGGLLQALSPEYDMKSQMEFRFSHDVYRDIGALYSPEYIAHRLDAKVEFLKHLSIIPNIDITPDDLILTPERAILTLPMKEGEKYTVTLRDYSDIYGRKASMEYVTRLQSEPFLSLRLSDNKQIYTPSEQIGAKLYSLLPAKNTYTLKLCRVELDTYARVERMITDPAHAKNTDISSLLISKDTSDCRKKDIVLKPGGYVSPFFVSDFFLGDTNKNGLYILSFSDASDTASFTKFISPILFSIIDTHITMKVDASGKIMVLATDIATGKPLPGEEITLMRNISRTHTEKWDPLTGKTENIYLPLTTEAFATGIVIGRTDARGYLDVSRDTLPGIDGYDSSPYGLSFESWWDYEGRYDSFIAISRSSSHLGYIVSTWNDGITGYNFGIKDSDYSYATRPDYTSYIHTDRKLYLPGEKVYIHAILRQNNRTLTIPADTIFDMVITDPQGREVKRSSLKSNEFGSIGSEFDLPKDTPLGSYTMTLSVANSSEYIENGYANFQVEVFKNPTFTASVELKSPDLENGMIRDLRKLPNTDIYNPWYSDVYSGNFTIEGVVKAKYYNGAQIKNTPFTYRVYRSDYYPDDYFGDCFWGCYYEPLLEHYTDGTGSIDSDGYGIVRIPVDFRSFYSDYKYTVEITLRDPLTGEEVTTPGVLVVKLPEAYKSFSLENPLLFTPKKKILASGEKFSGEVKPQYGTWDQSLSNKYKYEIIHRDYREVYIDDIRAGKMRITTPKDTVVASGTVLQKEISDPMIAMKSGEYHLRISPIISSGEPPESSISDTIFYISGNFSNLKDSTLRVIPEKTVYKAGEIARVMIQTPFTGSYLLITREKGGVIDREYVYLTGNTLTREYSIDDTMMPNAYIGVVALHPSGISEKSRTYAVGYGEIVTDIADKKGILTISTDKTTYKNRDTVNTELTLTDRSGNPLQGEITMMVVDESLIRLLGNIDLDIIPKFYQKYPFTVKTALSAIGIERNRFLSRKGSNGGGGDKGGGGEQISSRTLFKNTAYYNASIRTDISGKAKVSFSLPDNVTDYRIITIGNTRDSKFAVAEKTIEVRKDYVLEASAPMIIRTGDTFTLTATAFNNTKRITPVDMVLTMGTGGLKVEKKTNLSLDIGERKSTDFSLVNNFGKDTISYTLELREKDKILDSITHTIAQPALPIMTPRIRSIAIFTGSVFHYVLPTPQSSLVDMDVSSVEVSASTNYAVQIGKGISSLLQYPYGCIEQTIASTLPNRIALSLSSIFQIPIDMTRAEENTKKGLKKILGMQHFSGGWVYWEGANEANVHITPYVLRSLQKFQELGEYIPQEVYDNGITYIINNEAVYQENPDDFAEAVWTLASLRDHRALIWWSRIDITKLSRHGYLAYAYAAQKLGKYTPQIDTDLRKKLTLSTDTSWYWTQSADTSIFTQLLLDRQDRAGAVALLDPIIRNMDMSSYYVSTQEKIQTLLALISLSKDTPKLIKPISIALRGDTLIADMTLSGDQPTASLSTSRAKIGASYTLKRDDKKTPLYITTTILDRPKDITKTPSYQTGGMTISRTFELIDESKGVDEKGEFIVRSRVADGLFHKGKLYKVTLSTKFPGSSSRHISLEDFFPGGWRPINGVFKTEQSLLRAGGNTWWDYIESREDRLLIYREYSYGEDTLEYTYYIRPESLGDYLLPPATSYLMYMPEIHAYTSYERIKVTQ